MAEQRNEATAGAASPPLDFWYSPDGFLNFRHRIRHHFEGDVRGGSASHSGDMTDKESRALVRGMLLADRKGSGPGWGATIAIAILTVPAVMLALGFLVAWQDDRLGEVLSLEPAGYYESVDRTTCKDIVAIGGTCRSPLPRR